MKLPRERLIESLFHRACATPPERRREFLVSQCGGDEILREEIESLLAFAEPGEGSPLAAPAIRSVAPESAEPRMPRLQGRRLGNYLIEREIGRGGMGIVYLASGNESARAPRAAVKVAKPDAESRNAIARLLRERRLLAELDHPNIAKLLDAGETAEGLPYLVMEFVEGSSLRQYCDAKRLSARARAELLLPVCEAIACAHRRGILHRDLKPTNVIVTAQGVPKLLDFGLAKRFGKKPSRGRDPNRGETTLTRSGLRALTPEYASPEQIRGEELSPASDLYSLGVIAYELLAGRRPHDPRGEMPHEVERAICEDDPMPASVASQIGPCVLALGGGLTSEGPEAVAAKRGTQPRALRVELARRWDAILLRALERDPAKRFASVNDFAAALREGLQRSWMPRMRGALLRTRYRAKLHRVRLAAGAVLVSMLAGTAAVAEWIFDPARSNPQNKVIAGLHEMGFAMHARGDDASSEGMYLLAREMQQRFFGETHPSQASSLNALGALALGNKNHDKSEKHFREALAILRRSLPQGHPELVATLIGLGMLLNDARRFEEAQALFAEAAEIAQREENARALPAWALPIVRGELGFALCQIEKGSDERSSAGKEMLFLAAGRIRELFGPEHEQTRRAESHLRACD